LITFFSVSSHGFNLRGSHPLFPFVKMAALIHEAALKFGTSGTLNEKELNFLWDAYDADKNGDKL
jgi:hypothetical protein